MSRSLSPTVQMVIDVDAPQADLETALSAIDDVTRASENVYVDANGWRGSCSAASCRPTSSSSARPGSAGRSRCRSRRSVEAFTLNAVAVELNLAAFEWGRASVAAPETVAAALRGSSPPSELAPRERALVDRAFPEEGELRRRIQIRVADLVGWGGYRAAERYVRAVAAIRELEDERLPGSTAVSEAYATGMHKLMAYKDEYEVARLHLDGIADLPEGSKVTFMLHPPILRAMGMDRKLALGSWFIPAFKLLRGARRLRGTPLDVFGYAAVRRRRAPAP